MQSIYKLLSVNKKAAHAIYRALLRVKGVECIVNEPITKGSIFGLEDLVSYDEQAMKVKQLLVFNIFQEGFTGSGEFDPFYSQNQTFILTPFEEQLPLQTRVSIDFLGKRLTMKVDDHTSLTPDVAEPLFVKNILVAAT